MTIKEIACNICALETNNITEKNWLGSTIEHIQKTHTSLLNIHCNIYDMAPDIDVSMGMKSFKCQEI